MAARGGYFPLEELQNPVDEQDAERTTASLHASSLHWVATEGTDQLPKTCFDLTWHDTTGQVPALPDGALRQPQIGLLVVWSANSSACLQPGSHGPARPAHTWIAMYWRQKADWICGPQMLGADTWQLTVDCWHGWEKAATGCMGIWNFRTVIVTQLFIGFRFDREKYGTVETASDSWCWDRHQHGYVLGSKWQLAQRQTSKWLRFRQQVTIGTETDINMAMF